MKRSEMIELMWNFIQQVQCGNVYYMDKTDTSKLLNKMEQAGMYPERYEAVMATGKKYNSETDQGRDTIIVNGWEPED